MVSAMQIDPPIWHLRNQRCTFCEEGELSFFTCPECRGLVLVCGECSAVFSDLRTRSRVALGLRGDLRCPHCDRSPAADFTASNVEEIQGAGFTPAEYT